MGDDIFENPFGDDIFDHPFAESTISQNGHFVLAWLDASPDGMSAGGRDSGEGQYELSNDSIPIVKGNMPRPNDGKVSNQGNFILNDWTFEPVDAGAFYAFDAKGNILISRRYQAYLLNNGISTDGHYAVCQTHDSNNEDGNKLSFFDLTNRQLVWNCEPISGRAENYRFDSENSILYLLYEGGGSYRYDFKGNFLDGEQWEKESIDSADGYKLFDLATAKIDELEDKAADLSSYDDAISLLKRAIDEGMSDYFQARAHRILGEVLLKRGQRQEAIENFEKALSADPRVGVKKLLAKLKSENQ